MQKEVYSANKLIKVWITTKKVLDVILFGSSIREKSKPKDIDLCILISDIDEEKSMDLVDSLGKSLGNLNLSFHINILTSSSFVKGDTLVNTLLSEGYSIKKGEMFSSVFGYTNKSLFIYSLKKFTPSKRVKVHYMLRGRYGSKGILAEVNGNFLGTGSIIVPTEKEDLLKEIFDKWDVEYKIERILLVNIIN